MSDLISRQDAIDAILDLTDFVSVIELFEYVEEYDLQDKRSGGIIDAIDAVLLLPSVQPEQRWIPCSERLPGRGVSVLVSHVGYVYEDYLDIDDCDGELYFWNSGLFLYDERQNIAWMPLPEPYKGDNQDG